MTEAVRWVSSSLEEVADDREADDEEESIPLVPLSEEATAAMENTQFLKLLTALGLCPPSDEQVCFHIQIMSRTQCLIHESFMIKLC
jgi:Timeless protein C terminal region.